MSREGYKMTELGEIPIEWEVKPIREVAEVNPESLGSKTDKDFIINYIDIESVSTGKISNIKELSFGEAPSRARRKVRKDDVIISTVRPYLKAFTLIKSNTENLVCSTGFAVLRAKNNNLPQYIYQCTLSDSFLNQLSNKMVGSNYPAVNSSDVQETLIPIPPLLEQKKIADILSTVDKQIEQTDALIEKTKQLKKGLMQRLLTKGIGHTEFKDTEIGTIPKEWEVVKLGEVVEIVNGATPSTKVEKYWVNGSIPWATPSDITSNGKYISATEKYITEDGLKNSSMTLLPSGSILMTSRATIGEKCINTLPMATNQGFKSMICSERIQNEFLYYMIDLVKIDFIKLASGSTFLEISKKDIELYKILLPPIQEQIYIANILCQVDKNIELCADKKESLQKLKNALLQKLLTGKIRVY
ncbi:MAG TPA: restriction endonuclease subunit S [Acetivibrio sp.]|uniref:restriction endonuclease subunit S n=1 Tax=Acetivibrio sp. TaxID=1872092 RepID=UPI002C9C8BD4|nr:restriction endonuclease subunit S [Acetivibrio sp.]HOM02774.1 restriction endonuclease subunit S [Acetivibrio sp.]